MPSLSQPEIAAALRVVPLFADLEDRQIQALTQRAVVRRAEPGEWIFTEGDQCQGLYVIFSGALKIFKQS
ncbi:MAG: cyclic nucleotide-binding domain-containing protein, partial [Acidobacteria bacterium]|nr:cyclic nucleotide-binding domain-containing protein [Acidobacteriota bacterium]